MSLLILGFRFFRKCSRPSIQFGQAYKLRTFTYEQCQYKDYFICRCNSYRLKLSTCSRSSFTTSAFQNDIAKPLDRPVLHETVTVRPNTGAIGKVFYDSEAEFHHEVLKNSRAYSGTIYKEDPSFFEKYSLTDDEYKNIIDLSLEDWKNKSISDTVTAFVSLGLYSSAKLNLPLDEPQFNSVVSTLVENLPSSTDDELIDCFVALKYWPTSTTVKDPNFLKVWKSLDSVCLQRYLQWTTDKKLFMMDLWFLLKLTRLSQFIFIGLKTISRKTEDLTAAQLIQTMFFMSCARKLHGAISMREYEHYIQNYITKLSIEEIGIFCLAFFKTKTTIYNTKVLIYIMQRVVEEIETIQEITLTAIAKTLRYSHKAEIGFTANDLVNKLVENRMDTLPLINIIHIIHISTQIQFYNEEAITKLVKKFCENPSEARLKDMERMAFMLSLYNFIPPSTPDVCQVIVKQLDEPRNIEAANNHPLIFLSLIYFLSLLQTFPEKHIRKVLDEEALHKRYDSRYMMPAQAVQLDYNRVLEGPPGSEHLLSPSLREYLARRFSLYIPDKLHKPKFQFDKLLSEVIGLTSEILGGEEYNLVAYTLPHFPRADILFHLDENGNPLPIPEVMRNRPPFEDVYRPPDSRGWYCVMIGGRNMYMHNVPKLVGEQVTKLRQLKLLGYTPIVIPSYFWSKEEDKKGYLKLKYFSKTK